MQTEPYIMYPHHSINGMTAYVQRYSCQKKGPTGYSSCNSMPSISPVHEIIEPGSKDFCSSLDLMSWNGAPKYSSEAECKGLPISGFVNHLLATESIIPTDFENGNPEYTTDCGYTTNVDTNFWEHVHPRNWSSSQVIDWLYYVVFIRDFDSVHLDSFRTISGKELVQMKKLDLFHLLRNEGYAERVYLQVQQLLCQFDYSSNNPSNLQNVINNLSLTNSYETNNGSYQYIADMYTDLEQTRNNTYNIYNSSDTWCNTTSRSDVESDGECNRSPYTSSPYPDISIKHPEENPHRPPKRGPGRPAGRDGKKKKTGQRSSRLWEFIRDLLKDKETCPRLVKWEDREEGVFRFVQSDQVAKLWGERKSNPRMTYEKLSRAMRYYYKSKVLQPVLGRRLVYKFGPSATGWRPHEV